MTRRRPQVTAKRAPTTAATTATDAQDASQRNSVSAPSPRTVSSGEAHRTKSTSSLKEGVGQREAGSDDVATRDWPGPCAAGVCATSLTGGDDPEPEQRAVAVEGIVGQPESAQREERGVESLQGAAAERELGQRLEESRRKPLQQRVVLQEDALQLAVVHERSLVDSGERGEAAQTEAAQLEEAVEGDGVEAAEGVAAEVQRLQTRERRQRRRRHRRQVVVGEVQAGEWRQSVHGGAVQTSQQVPAQTQVPEASLRRKRVRLQRLQQVPVQPQLLRTRRRRSATVCGGGWSDAAEAHLQRVQMSQSGRRDVQQQVVAEVQQSQVHNLPEGVVVDAVDAVAGEVEVRQSRQVRQDAAPETSEAVAAQVQDPEGAQSAEGVSGQRRDAVPADVELHEARLQLEVALRQRRNAVVGQGEASQRRVEAQRRADVVDAVAAQVHGHQRGVQLDRDYLQRRPFAQRLQTLVVALAARGTRRPRQRRDGQQCQEQARHPFLNASAPLATNNFFKRKRKVPLSWRHQTWNNCPPVSNIEMSTSRIKKSKGRGELNQRCASGYVTSQSLLHQHSTRNESKYLKKHS